MVEVTAARPLVMRQLRDREPPRLRPARQSHAYALYSDDQWRPVRIVGWARSRDGAWAVLIRHWMSMDEPQWYVYERRLLHPA
jgi:hypothetical protein